MFVLVNAQRTCTRVTVVCLYVRVRVCVCVCVSVTDLAPAYDVHATN